MFMVLLRKLRGRSRLTGSKQTNFQIDKAGIKIINAGHKSIRFK
jgi:hypothetical protein